jgi:hypothetical protein
VFGPGLNLKKSKNENEPQRYSLSELRVDVRFCSK